MTTTQSEPRAASGAPRAPALAGAVRTARPRWRGFPLSVVCGQLVAVVAAFIGSAELHDNSFFTHLATGRLLLHRGLGTLWNGMPDPYTYTSGGRNWIVQSWFASVLYAGSENLAGAAGIRMLTALTCALLGVLVWRLTRRAETLIPRVIVTGLVLVVGATAWASRPFLFGLVCFALTMLAAEGDLDPRWLVPIGWVWVNTHGSFPLGVVALVALAVGRRLDGDRPVTELRALRWGVAGILVGGVANPVGPKLLAFPLTMLTRSDVLANIAEWKSPDFAQSWARVFLLTALVAIVVIVRRPSYRSVLMLAVFLGCGLLALRNVSVAMIAIVPGMAASLRGLGTIDGSERSTGTRVAAVVLAAASPLIILAACAKGDVDLRGYPVHALDWMGNRGLLDGHVHVAEEDFVGNLLELRLGAGAHTFIDDRYELHDRGLVRDYRILNDGLPGWDAVLDRRNVDVVVWRRDSPLASLLAVAPGWRIAFDDTTAAIPPGPDAALLTEMAKAKPFVVACRPTVTACFG